ncbi:MAG: TlpA family protein disulfide reductase [Methanocellales archaeon]|nr:TlpA family protein disulfide reductase [Methanocellales archaeon]
MNIGRREFLKSLAFVGAIATMGFSGCVSTQEHTPDPTPTITQKPTPVATPTPVSSTPMHTPNTKPRSTQTLLLAPDFNLTDAISGDNIKLSDYRGKVVLLDFFSTECGACITSIHDDLLPLHEQYGKRMKFLSIHIREPEVTVNYLDFFAKEWDIKWPILIGSNSQIQQIYNVKVVPTIYIIDDTGVIRYLHLGSSHTQTPGFDVLKVVIDSLLV